jgi:hypothetical protein
MNPITPYENMNMDFDALKKGIRDPRGTRALMNAVMSKDAIRETILRDILHKRPSPARSTPEMEC